MRPAPEVRREADSPGRVRGHLGESCFHRNNTQIAATSIIVTIQFKVIFQAHSSELLEPTTIICFRSNVKRPSRPDGSAGSFFSNVFQRRAALSGFGQCADDARRVARGNQHRGGRERAGFLDIRREQLELGRELINMIEMAPETARRCEERREGRGLSPGRAVRRRSLQPFRRRHDVGHLRGYFVGEGLESRKASCAFAPRIRSRWPHTISTRFISSRPRASSGSGGDWPSRLSETQPADKVRCGSVLAMADMISRISTSVIGGASRRP